MMFDFQREGYRTESGYMNSDSGDVVFREGVIKFIENLYLCYWEEGDTLHKFLLTGLFLSLGTALFSIFLISAFSPLFYLIMVVSFPTGLSAVILFRQFFTSRTNDRRIPKDNIKFVRFDRGRKLFRKPKATFIYKEGRKDKKRKVNFPSLVAPRSEEILDEAEGFLKEEGIKVK